jgi:hypothetical protein
LSTQRGKDNLIVELKATLKRIRNGEEDELAKLLKQIIDETNRNPRNVRS